MKAKEGFTPPVAPPATARPLMTPTPASTTRVAPGATTADIATIATDFSPIMEPPVLPVSFVPTPTRQYREHRKARRATLGTGTPVRTPIPRAVINGARVLMWKWDPVTGATSVRKAFLAGHILAGPRNARIAVQGVTPVIPNVLGDLIETPGTEAFDAVHTFAVVRQTLTMFQRALFPTSVPWQWNSPHDTEPINVFPRAGEAMNAFYSRNERALKFFCFAPPGTPATVPSVYTCRSQDIVAHETGHAVLDGFKPNWIPTRNPPQTGALHEAFADLTAIFLTLSQPEQVAAIVAQTKANVHNKTFLPDMVEELSFALGRPTGLLNADNELTLAQVGAEVHDLAQVFTGAVYDILADIVAFELKPNLDPAAVLYTAAEYLCSLLIRAVKAAPDTNPSFADVVNQMLSVAQLDDKPVQYRNFIRNRFVLREVVASRTPPTADHQAGEKLEAKVRDAPDAIQTRHACCGTMQHPQYAGEESVDSEIEQFVKGLSKTESVSRR